MSKMLLLIKRNTKLFFKDKGAFFPSLITPVILLVLYATFLADVFKDSIDASLNGALAAIGQSIILPAELIEGFVGGQIMSSLLAVCCVTIAFCSNMTMVSDKVTGARKDLTIAPVSGSMLALGYYLSSLISTLIICFVAMGACLIYISIVGWYLSAADVILIALDVFLLSMFGTALSSVINFFLSSQGQISAIGTIVSSGYGFICGAYMPISSFPEGLQSLLSFLPGTYGTSLLRTHCMRGAINSIGEKMGEIGGAEFADETVKTMKQSMDCTIYFFEREVSPALMYTIICGAVLLLVGAYVLMNILSAKRARR